MSFFGITNITAFVLGTIFIILLPGPNSLYVLTVAVKRGVGWGFLGAFGIFVGDAILMLLTALGAASVLDTYPLLYNIFRYGGALYLSWIGFQLIRVGFQKWRVGKKYREDNAQDAEALNQAINAEAHLEKEHVPHPFMRALIISLLNPKAILFFLSFFLQFVDPLYPKPYIPFLIEAVIVQICSALYLTAIIFFGSRLAESFRARHRITSILNGLVGSLFVGYGLKLILDKGVKIATSH